MGLDHMSVKKHALSRLRIALLLTGLGLLTLTGCNRTTPLIPEATHTAATDSLRWQSPLLQEHPLTGRIFSTHSQQEISQRTLLAQLEPHRLLLLGEKHDNPDHHQIEALLLRRLLNANSSVVFEMLDDQHNTALTTVNGSDSLETLHRQLNWRDKGWNWPAYGPLIQLSLQQQAQVLPGNVSKPLLQTIYRTGTTSLSDASYQHRFATVNAANTTIRQQIQQLVYDSHCQMMPLEQMAPMVDIQLARDASMAHAMTANLAARERVILLAGGVHTRKDLGVPLHLQALATEAATTEARPAVVLLVEVEAQALHLTDYPHSAATIADYVWFTPKFTARDYCDDLKPRTRNLEPRT